MAWILPFVAAFAFAQTAAQAPVPASAAPATATTPVAATAPAAPATPSSAPTAKPATSPTAPPSAAAPSATATPVPATEPPPSPADLQRLAIQKQREAIQRQAQGAGARLKPWGSVAIEPGPTFDSERGDAPKADCDALDESVSKPLVENTARAQGVDPSLLHAVIDQESGFHPCAVSVKGAQGLMQLMPATADSLQVDDPFDPKQNIEAGAKYLKQMLDKFGGDITKALGAYNAGPNSDDPANRIPETKNYVNSILTKMGIKHTDPQSIQTPKPIGN